MKISAYQLLKDVEQEIEKLSPEIVRSRNTRKGKKLIKEMRPPSRLALLFKRPDQNALDETTAEGDEADGVIYMEGYHNNELRIQIACDFDYEESLPMELLNNQGYAPESGPIRRNNRSKEIESELCGVNSEDFIFRCSSRILELCEKKANKEYQNKMVLLLSFHEIKISGLSSGFYFTTALSPDSKT